MTSQATSIPYQGAQGWLAGIDGQPFSYYQWWPEPSQTVKGIVQIVHGSLDHGRRYWHFAEHLARSGFVAVASDNRGHGNSASVSGGLGQAGPDAWNGIVQDLRVLSEHLMNMHPGRPVFLVGHAMGTVLVRDYIQRQSGGLGGVVLSSPLPQTPNLGPAIEALEQYIAAVGTVMPAHSMEASIEAYNAPFQPTDTKWAWFTRDKAEIARFEADPQCQFDERVDFILDMLRAEQTIHDPDNQDRVERSLPVLFLGGAANPVIRFGDYVRELQTSWSAAGFQDVEHRIYAETRHQLLHEVNREAVYGDIVNWMEDRL